MEMHQSTLPPFTTIDFSARGPFEHGLVFPEVDNGRSGQLMTFEESLIATREQTFRQLKVVEQLFIARWKEHLQWKPTLPMCQSHNILASRPWFRICTTPFANMEDLTLIKDLTALVFDLYNNHNHHNPNNNNHVTLKSMLLKFLSRTPPRDQSGRLGLDRLKYFIYSAAPQALVMLYTSSHQPNSDLANDAIQEFILRSSEYQDRVPNYKHALAFVISRWLGCAVGIYDPLYGFCRANFRRYEKNGLSELATRLLHGLELSKHKSVSSYYDGPALRDVKDLAAFLVLVKNDIMALRSGPGVDQMLPLCEEELSSLPPSFAEQITCLHPVFLDLLHKLDECLVRIEEDGGMQQDGCCHYLAILKELNTISKLYQGAEEVFWDTVKQRKAALCYLIARFVKRIDDDHKWILEAKEATNFETQRHLATMMFPGEDLMIIKDLTILVFDLYNNNDNPNSNVTVNSMLLKFLSRTPLLLVQAWDRLQYFVHSAVPQALVMLYTSSHQPNTDLAKDAIREFISKSSEYENRLPNYKHYLALIFSKWLGCSAGIYDPLYTFCLSNFMPAYNEKYGFCVSVSRLLHDLELSKSVSSFYIGPSLRDVKELALFLGHVKNKIIALRGDPVVDQRLPLSEAELALLSPSYAEQITYLHQVFLELLHKLDECLVRIEEEQVNGGMQQEDRQIGCCHYLAILKELNTISKLYQGTEEEMFWETVKQRKAAVCYLIVRFVKRFDDDHKWILEAKEATNFETRKHLAMMMFPEVKSEDEEEMHQILIDRSRLFAKSFKYITRADPESLRAGLSIKFKNEDAAGPAVRSEWFHLVCQAIFSPQNTLFLACPNDHRRFFPNPASKVDPLHLQYFGFSGRVIALAMMYKVQVGIVFDRVFSLQLVGYSISLEDIRDADPYLYSSCKQILEMDPEVLDQDILGLTFIHEVEEFGKRKVVELCTDGGNVAVNSKNRKEYIDSLIQHRFVTAVSEQIAHFAQGFAEVMSCGSLQRSFFQCLEAEDLDRVLCGSESAISVHDWMPHTKYRGFKATDCQISVDDWMAPTEYRGFKATDCKISWFWKVVECMSMLCSSSGSP